MKARSAAHSLSAFSASVSNTGCRSKVDRPITLSSSLVAVCCSSEVRSSPFRASSSWNSRTFWMAITAWSAKVWSSATRRSGNSPATVRVTVMAPMGRPSRSIGTATTLRKPLAWAAGRSAYVSSPSTSGTCTTRRSRIASVDEAARLGGIGNARRRLSAASGWNWSSAAMSTSEPS